MVQKIDDTKSGGAWTGANIKRDAGAAFDNKAVRIFVALVIIGTIINYAMGG